MSSINNLSQIKSVSAADQVALYSPSVGTDVRAALSVVADYVESALTIPGTLKTQYYAPNATGYSVTVSPPSTGDSVWLLITPTGAFAAGTIVLPAQAACVDGQELVVNSTLAVTTLTVSGNGSTVNGAPTTLAANGFFRLRFDGVVKAWYRIG